MTILCNREIRPAIKAGIPPRHLLSVAARGLVPGDVIVLREINYRIERLDTDGGIVAIIATRPRTHVYRLFRVLGWTLAIIRVKRRERVRLIRQSDERVLLVIGGER